MHKPIQIKDLSLSFSHKICFEDFNAQIYSADRIAIIGRNGSGKSTLLNILQGAIEATEGTILGLDNIVLGLVPQLIEAKDSLSGGQRFNAALTQALSLNPDILLLDEPTNHLDKHNRKSLMRMLQAYQGTLIIVSHDTELLRLCIDTLWHIDQGKIHIFDGKYDNYLEKMRHHRFSIEQELSQIKQQKKEMHESLMKEQKRAAKSKAKGEINIQQKKWPTIVSAAKASQAQENSGQKKAAIEHKKQRLIEQLSNLHLPEIIIPKFSIDAENITDKIILSISDGCIGYEEKSTLLKNINLSINSKTRIAIQGDNASGKSTLIKAILNDRGILKSGDWYTPNATEIGYLDQHYKNLCPEKKVLDTITKIRADWSYLDIRQHLNDFLFRKNEDVNNIIANLSGGEKARLTLAQIAAYTPKLLILDEITNNLDLETKEHVIQVLKAFPGAMILISHEEDFLNEIGVDDYYQIIDGEIVRDKNLG